MNQQKITMVQWQVIEKYWKINFAKKYKNLTQILLAYLLKLNKVRINWLNYRICQNLEIFQQLLKKNLMNSHEYHEKKCSIYKSVLKVRIDRRKSINLIEILKFVIFIYNDLIFYYHHLILFFLFFPLESFYFS